MGLRDDARRLLAASGGVIVISAVLVGPPASPAHAGAVKDWYYRNLTAELGAPGVYGEEIVSFTVGGADSRIYYQGSDDYHVHELAYWQGGWHYSDITERAGAPVADPGAFAGFAMDGDKPRLYHRGLDDHVYELSYSEGRWDYLDLTEAAGAPAIGVAALAAFQATDTDPRVYFSDWDGDVHELSYWGGSWHYRNLTARTGAPEGQCCDLVAFTAGGPDSRLYYRGRDDHMHELSYWGGGWHYRDLNADTGAPPASGGSNGIAGFTVGGAASRVFYEDDGKHVRELSYWGGGWHHRDLSAEVDASLPAITGVTGFPTGSGGDSRVYVSRSRDGHIYEYAFYEGEWHYRDVTAAAGAPVADSIAMTAFLVNGTDSRVYYATGQHLHELAEYEAPSQPPPGPETRTVALQRQDVWEGFVPYYGEFPSVGVVEPGRLIKIEFPRYGSVDSTLYLVKVGYSTQDCDDPNAVVALTEGQSTTPPQISAIFGLPEPRFSTAQHLPFVACLGIAGMQPPSWVDIEITVQFD